MTRPRQSTRRVPVYGSYVLDAVGLPLLGHIEGNRYLTVPVALSPGAKHPICVYYMTADYQLAAERLLAELVRLKFNASMDDRQRAFSVISVRYNAREFYDPTDGKIIYP